MTKKNISTHHMNQAHIAFCARADQARTELENKISAKLEENDWKCPPPPTAHQRLNDDNNTATEGSAGRWHPNAAQMLSKLRSGAYDMAMSSRWWVVLIAAVIMMVVRVTGPAFRNTDDDVI